MITDISMLKWIKKRTRILSPPCNSEPPCLSANKNCNTIYEGEQQCWAGYARTGVLNNQVCPMCRRSSANISSTDNCCRCREMELDNSDSIDYDIIKRQTARVHSIQIKNNLGNVRTPTKEVPFPEGTPLCRSRSDVTDTSNTPLPKRLSPRSRIPIINLEEFAEFSSRDESNAYGKLGCSGTSHSGYNSDDSLRTLLHQLMLKSKNGLLESPALSNYSSPPPKMGCRATIQRSVSAHGRNDATRNVTLRSQSLNREVRPSCGVKRSRSRANSFRREAVNVVSIKPQKFNCEQVINGDHSNGYLSNHIHKLSTIRSELQNLYSLDRNRIN